MAWTFPDDWIDISAAVTYNGAWTDIDLSSYVPTGTKRVFLFWYNNDTSSYRLSNVRANGSAVDDTAGLAIYYKSSEWAVVKVDSNRLIEGYFGNSVIKVYVVAYSPDDFCFTEFVDKSTATTGSYQTVDVSADGVPANSKLAYFQWVNTTIVGTQYQRAMREMGASYDYYYYLSGIYSGCACRSLDAIGLDANRQCEQEIAHANMDLHLVGYEDNATVESSPTNIAPGTTGSWQTVTVSNAPNGTAGLLCRIINTKTNTTYAVAVRKYGSSLDLSASVLRQSQMRTAVVGLDSSKRFEAYIANTAVQIIPIAYLPAQAYSLSVDSGSLSESGQSAGLLKNSLISADFGSFTETGQEVTLTYTPGSSLYFLAVDSGAFSESGQPVDLLRNALVPIGSGAFVETGQDVGLLRGMMVSAVSGSFSESGQTADLLKNSVMGINAGSFAESGQAVSLLRNALLGVDSGSFTESGQATSLLFGRVVGIASGAFTESGQAAGLLKGSLLSIGSGSFTESGVAAGLLAGRIVAANSGSFLESGSDVTFLRTYVVAASSGEFLFTGQEVTLVYTPLGFFILTADPGLFVEAGQDIGLLRGYACLADSASFTETGFDVSLLYSGGAVPPYVILFRRRKHG